jgi:2-oxoglutarate ferredoxin oxidoreductase subunit gamma
MQYDVLFAGFGGQGIMTAGQLLAYSGMAENKQVAWIPSYGPEMRGGTAYCTVVVSEHRIGSPIISNPKFVCVFNRPSFDKFVPRVKSGGLSIVNSSLIDVTTDRTDITELLVPANEMAMKAGNAKAANIVILGALIAATGIVSHDTVIKVINDKLGRKKSALPINLQAFEDGFALAGKSLGKTVKA